MRLTEGGKTYLAKLDANESPHGLPEDVVKAGRQAASHLYGDPNSLELRRKIAEMEGIDARQIVVSPGLEVMINDIAHACINPRAGAPFPPTGDPPSVLLGANAFYQYAEKAELHGYDVIRVPQTARQVGDSAGRPVTEVTIDIDRMAAAVQPSTRIVFVANPDNPSGGVLPWAEVNRLRALLPKHVLLVLDGAYAEFAGRKDYDQGKLLVAIGNTIVLRTFSKAYRMASDRVGWCYAPPAFARAIDHVRQKYAVTTTSEVHALEMLGRPALIADQMAQNARRRDKLARSLVAAGFDVWRSSTNFLNVGFGSADRAAAAHRFLADRAVATMRLGDCYGWPDRIRITIGNDKSCDLVAVLLGQFAKQTAVGGKGQ